jgi:hypothetical protein
MEKEKLRDILRHTEEKSNADLKAALTLLEAEYEDIKKLLVDLSHHLDRVEESHHKISGELKKRSGL